MCQQRRKDAMMAKVLVMPDGAKTKNSGNHVTSGAEGSIITVRYCAVLQLSFPVKSDS